MKEGIDLEDGRAKPDHIRILKYYDIQTDIKIAFHEGRNRLVKRFFSEFGHRVLKLKRISIGPIKLGKLPRGKWRDLTRKELNELMDAVD